MVSATALPELPLLQQASDRCPDQLPKLFYKEVIFPFASCTLPSLACLRGNHMTKGTRVDIGMEEEQTSERLWSQVARLPKTIYRIPIGWVPPPSFSLASPVPVSTRSWRGWHHPPWPLDSQQTNITDGSGLLGQARSNMRSNLLLYKRGTAAPIPNPPPTCFLILIPLFSFLPSHWSILVIRTYPALPTP